MLPDLTINNGIWLAAAIISFLAGQAFFFGRLLKWGEAVDKFFRR